ncbi:PREDICTED: uncharacterized protein LOC104818838 [Tarenaya hassleriana]|uniref:uncharacterized protein LOC104818838 n=1 Tax=Tarenaya hassleriana TaxID=28532 RepID=UPI00053C1E39|nr:PREDICTED: uncharacterized protein LOC104818838 [Tarenaya hassleriana]
MMNINRDEALRAKEIAEGLMKKADFTGARRLVVRAQKLDSNLENISHMMMVCDVHSAAAEKVFGNEMDWYGILQVDQKADDVAIKKQVKKLAFLLHPDKNKLPGAEAAFKLIAEAQRILLDRDKRSLYDMKRRTGSRPAGAPSCYAQNAVRTSQNTGNNFTGFRPENQKQQRKTQAQPAGFCGGTRFWTLCPFCHMRYEYPRVHVNKVVTCQKCKRRFTTFEVPFQSAPRAINSVQTTFSFPKPKHVPTRGACNARQNHPEDSASCFSRKESFPVSGCTARGLGEATSGIPRHQNVSNKNPSNVEQKHPQTSSLYHPVKDGTPVSGCNAKVGAENIGGNKKRKKIVESSESSDSESVGESEEVMIEKKGDVMAGRGLGSVGGQNLRRSLRRKRNISYNENSSDNERSFVNINQGGSKEKREAEAAEESRTRKQSCKDGSCNGTLPNGINKSKNSKETEIDQVGASKENSVFRRDSKSDSSLEGPRNLECADPDFNAFGELRKQSKFVSGQIWAVYDARDGMPRFYAYIRKVFASRFKLSITWLEEEPGDDSGISWVNADLPVAVGKFGFGMTENTVNHAMFSHVISNGERYKKPPFRVLPRKGETWALFKNWDINWSTDPDSHREYEYEFAEILSDHSDVAGVSVAFLRKVKGFTSVFCRMPTVGSDTIQIPAHELYRWSHSVPSFRLTGNEREDVPEGSYELDPAALPENTEEISAPAVVDSSPISETLDDHRSPASNPDGIVIPKPRFKDFDADKSEEKFQVGQIWALYGKDDGLPKQYAKIQRVEKNPALKLQITWLEPKRLPASVVKWRDGNIPVSCGTFGLTKGPSHTVTDVSVFSHRMEAESSGRGSEFTVLPEKGEVWAMYKNWSDGIKVSDLKKWEYDVVEVVEVEEGRVEVMVMERVGRAGTVFQRGGGGCGVRRTFPRSELMRLSHKVPKYRLRGTLRGCMELDPKALARNFFTS